MKLSRTVAYAIQATLQLAQSNSGLPVPCSQLASEGKMPERFLLQILRHLVTHGILHSTRGVDGGYALERGPETISLLEVIEAIDGPLSAAIPTQDGAEPALHESKLREALEVVPPAHGSNCKRLSSRTCWTSRRQRRWSSGVAGRR